MLGLPLPRVAIVTDPELPEMHLKKIKLSGFKSFVDPITIPFEGKLIGIVGPNGCGK